jgi:hypothetical protein
MSQDDFNREFVELMREQKEAMKNLQTRLSAEHDVSQIVRELTCALYRELNVASPDLIHAIREKFAATRDDESRPDDQRLLARRCLGAIILATD